MSAKPFRRIGVIGGMGPEATVLLMSRIIAATPVEDDADHVPLLVDSNPQIPSRIKALIERTGEDPAPVLTQMARRLEAMGADALAMPCNTAHHYAPQIKAAVSIPMLDMVERSVSRLARHVGKQTAPVVGMLCSPAVRITGIFDKKAQALGLKLHYLADDTPLLDLIRLVKKSGASQGARVAFTDICKELLRQGSTTLLIACSELSMLADAAPSHVEVVDTIDVLAEACVSFSRGLGLERENAA